MIPNQWYPILESRRVTTRPVGVRRCGSDVVLWRRSDGELVCQLDRCPHKGAKLSLGKVVGNSIECPYHGFRYDAAGQCVLMPCMGKAAQPPAGMCTQRLITREHDGLIWMWYGAANATLPDLPLLPELQGTESVHATTSWDRPVNYTRYIESLLEFYHITFVHRDHWFNYVDYLFLYGTPRKLGLDGKQRYLDATKISNYQCTSKDERIDCSFDLVIEDDPTFKGTHYAITFRAPNTVNVVTQQFKATAWYTPIDDDHTHFILRWYEYDKLRTSLRHPGLRRILPWMSLYLEKWVQDEQDVRVLLSQTPRISDVGANRLIAVDAMNSKYLAMRRRLIREATEGSAAGHVDDTQRSLRVIAQ